MDRIMVHLDKVTKSFGDVNVIKNITLDIYEGEFLTLLGPSGCGKTTILRMISGLDTVTSGKVYIDDLDVTNIDPTKREVNTIFQNFALFPHMTVKDNISFGMKMQKKPQEYIDKKVKEAIDLVKLNGLENRLPKELSGGQQQRVAIARGIVMNPKVLLLDESLCSLDLKLKKNMQIELKKLQKKLGITFIYVTHDQDEALTMSDRIAIINKGKIEQLDTPQNIYRKPKTTFVADFIGESNIFDCVIERAKVKLNDNIVLDIIKEDHKNGDKVDVIIRPEVIDILKHKAENTYEGKIKDLIYDGQITKLEILVDNIIFKVTTMNSEGINIDDTVYLRFNKENLIIIGK